jgi:hypothetical protein
MENMLLHLLKQVKASKLYQAKALSFLVTKPSVSGTGLTEKVPTGGGQGLTANNQ